MAQTKKDDLIIKAAAAAVIALAVLAAIYWLSRGQSPAVTPMTSEPTVEQAATSRPPVKPPCELGEPDLYETGYLKNETPSAATSGEGWKLEYQRLKKPTQSVSLCFAKGSLCLLGDNFTACDPSQLVIGDDVRIEGHKNADGTYGVVRLLMIKPAAAPKPAP